MQQLADVDLIQSGLERQDLEFQVALRNTRLIALGIKSK